MIEWYENMEFTDYLCPKCNHFLIALIEEKVITYVCMQCNFVIISPNPQMRLI